MRWLDDPKAKIGHLNDRRVMLFWIVVAPAAMIVLLLWLVTDARAVASPRLSMIATDVAGYPVVVDCASRARWAAIEDISGKDLAGLAPDHVNEIWLAPEICATLTNYRRASIKNLSFALLVLLHESVHKTGLAGESVADCAALGYLRRYAIRYFGFRARPDALARLEAYAWEWHRAAPAAYRSYC